MRACLKILEEYIDFLNYWNTTLNLVCTKFMQPVCKKSILLLDYANLVIHLTTTISIEICNILHKFTCSKYVFKKGFMLLCRTNSLPRDQRSEVLNLDLIKMWSLKYFYDKFIQFKVGSPLQLLQKNTI